MKKYLLANSLLVITRQVGGNSQTFNSTYGEALSNDDFTTSSGTVRVFVELHDDEYKNFMGCDPCVRFNGKNGKKAYLEESDLYFISESGITKMY